MTSDNEGGTNSKASRASRRRKRCKRKRSTSSSNDDDNGSMLVRTGESASTPPGTPPRSRQKKRSRRKRRSSSHTDDERSRSKKGRKTSSRISASAVLKLIEQYRKDSKSENNHFSNSSLNNVIPEFNPSNRTQTIDCWLRKVNECALIYDWDERQTVHFSLQKLVGVAKKWFEALPSVVYSWEEWQSKLRKAFPSEENYGQILQDMLARTTRNDESLRDYFYDKQCLLNRCQIVGKKAVDCIIHGISDRSVRTGAQALGAKEPEELLHFLGSQKPQPFNNKFRDRSNQHFIRSDSQKSKENRTLICFNCRAKGHVYQNCDKPLIKCKRCNMLGHEVDKCRFDPNKYTKNKTDQVGNGIEKKTMKIISNNKGNEKFFKTVNVKDQPFEAYIDFGSECTLMRRTDAETLGLAQKHEGVPIIKGFGLSTVIPLYKSHACVKVDEVELTIEILVVEDQNMQTSLIIGQNFTESPSVTVLKDSDRLTFYQIPNQDLFDVNDTLKLYVTDTVTVSKISVVPVHTESKYTGDIFIEGHSRMEPGNEYKLLHGVYSMLEGKGNVVVSNLSLRTVILDSKTLIARSFPFVESQISRVNKIDTDVNDLAPLNRSEIKTGSELGNNQLEQLYELLQKYRDCFALNLEEIGCAKSVEMKINLVDDKPVVYRPYRLSHFEREQVRETIDELLQNDIIQESTSDYASPILMVKKKTGEQRLCVDFRALNNKTVKDRFPLPLIEDQITNLSGSVFFTTLDLASGYYQIPMAKESQPLTGFVTPDGHYEFKRMPFGLANAPAVFQRMINKILGNRRFEYALAYLDDILIPSKSSEEMFQRLRDVLELLRENGLTLKLSKCRFFDLNVNYLGYDISAQGIQPGQTKVSAVKDFPKPKNVHEIRQFLGLTGYFRKFIKGYGEIARPLTSLLRKEAVWQWSENEEQAFIILKERLVSRPLLALYDSALETELHTDASSLGIGGILMQWQRHERVLKPVAYFSRQTTPEEKHLHSYELETLAVVCSLKKFRIYLLGIQFKVYTDCAALRTTLTKRDLIPRIARWWLQISEYTFEIEYRPGVQMCHVDALSRNTQLKEPEDNPSVNVYTIEKENWLLTLQIADPDISRIHQILRPEDIQEFKDIRQNFTVKNHTVYRKVEDRLCLVVPRSARWQICRANHDEIGHLGYTKTLERIQSQYWFPKLRKFVKKYVAACLECSFNKDNSAKQKSGYLYPIEKISIPFHTVHMDHLGPFVKSKDGNTHILTVVEAFTKYVFVRPVRDLKTKSTIRVLEKIFYDFGVPARIISDRGTSFTSSEFKQFCVKMGIKHVLNAVACPRANGQAERFNQTILNSLAAQNFSSHERDWDKCLGKVQFGINNTINASTKKTATEAMFGFKMRDPLSNKLDPIGNESITNIDIQKLRHEISNTIENKQIKDKERYDSKRVPATKYVVGDLVKILRNNYDNNGKSTKLLSKFIGPYKISESMGNDRYKIIDVPGFNKRSKPYNTVISADRMRPWIHIKSLEVHESDESSSTDDSEIFKD